jgi:hypothetical protein
MPGSGRPAVALNLRAGEWVEVRSREEVLATLDERARYQNMPFMPEMLQLCGQRFRVVKRSDKTCDPGHTPWSIRRMKDTVHLEGVRCGGEGHGGCQAGCLIWWNEAWLKRVDGSAASSEDSRKNGAGRVAAGGSSTVATVLGASQSTNAEGETIYSCQATEIRDFTFHMNWWDPRQYVRDLRSGNLNNGYSQGSASERVLDLILGVLRVTGAFFISFFTERRLLSYPAVVGRADKGVVERSDLQPGDLVQVRSGNEIMGTLDKTRRNRGLLFDGEMFRYCGGVHRVMRRVDRIVDERTGKMISMKHPCIILDGVVCQSDFHRLCPRAIYHYWRENWLQRADRSGEESVAERAVEVHK